MRPGISLSAHLPCLASSWIGSQLEGKNMTNSETTSALNSSARDDEPAAEFYDFLYRDHSRLASYYSQVFSGRLTSIEESLHDKSVAETSGRLGPAALLSGELKNISEDQRAQRLTRDPLDMITIEILARLRERGFIQDIDTAPNGGVILLTGGLTLIDRSILNLAMDIIQPAIKPAKQNRSLTEEQNNMLMGIKAFRAFDLPAAFHLQADSGTAIGGTLKSGGMEEPIPTYYFKHGASGICDVSVIGIKEVGSTRTPFPENHIFAAAQQLAQNFSEFLLPPGTHQVTPLAMFRAVRPRG